MAEHFINVLVAILYIILPIFNTLQILKIKNILSKN